jgi:hypothetical protein
LLCYAGGGGGGVRGTESLLGALFAGVGRCVVCFVVRS